MKLNREKSTIGIEKRDLVRALRQVPSKLKNKGVEVNENFQEAITYFVRYLAEALESSQLSGETRISPENYALLYNTTLETLIHPEDCSEKKVYTGDLERLYEGFDLLTKTVAEYALGRKHN